MNAAATMRQSPADDELVELLAATRPWDDTAAVASGLRRWIDARGWEVEDVQDVADKLADLGQWQAQLGPEEIAGIAAFMLRNVANGRKPTDYGMDEVTGIAPRTRRRYISQFGSRAVFAWLESWQYDLDVAALVRGGRSPSAARRWLQRNPGKHAKDAPPARPRATPAPAT